MKYNFIIVIVMLCSVHGKSGNAIDLFPSDNFSQWTKVNGKPVGSGWMIKNGVIHRKSLSGDIITKEKFKDFEIGTNFYSWACQIAYWKIRAARKKYATSKVIFNQEVLDVIAQTRGQMEEELNSRHQALSRCLKKLNDRDRRMVLIRYESGKNVSAAAHACGRSVQGAYKALNRIRKALFDCVTFELTIEKVK